MGDGDAAGLGGLQVHIIVSHALAGDELQLGQGVDDPCGQRLEDAHDGVGVLAILDDIVLGGADVLLHLAHALQRFLLQSEAIFIIEHAHSFVHTKTLQNKKLDTMIIVAAYSSVKL